MSISIFLSWIVNLITVILGVFGTADYLQSKEAIMAINPYVNFNGNCLEAVKFYQEVFDAPSPEIMWYSDMPPDPEFPLSEDMKKLVMHTELQFEGGTIMFSDVLPGSSFTQGNSTSLMVSSKDEKAMRRYWERLKEGGTVDMELGPQFWSPLYGFVTDKFGIGWNLDLDTSN